MSDNVKVEVLPIEEIAPDPHNPNKGTPRGKAMTDFSVNTFGAGRGIALDKDNRAVAGNKTLQSAAAAGIKQVVVVETDGDVLVATRRRDWDLQGDDPAAREYSIADNRTGEIGLAWDADAILSAVEQGADLSVLFYDDEQKWLLDEAQPQVEEDERFGEKPSDLVPEMALHPFEHYDYMLVIFRSTLDWSRALDLLAEFGLVKQGMTVSRKTRKVGLCRVVDGGKLLDKLAEAGSSEVLRDAR